MGRIIGIDYGQKRTGIAISDPLSIFASPLESIPTTNIVQYLKLYSQKEAIEMFVVGYPKRLNNEASDTTQRVDNFIKLLQKHFPNIPVEKEDERLTTIIAQRAMIDGGMKKTDRQQKGVADKISASIILQGYLDRAKK